MKVFNWYGEGNYDYMAMCDVNEVEKLLRHFEIDSEILHKAKLEDAYCILFNSTDKIFSFIPYLSLAFGGMYNGNYPFSDSNIISYNELYEYDYKPCSFDEK